MSNQDPYQQPPQNPYSGPQPTDPYSGGQSEYQQQGYSQPGQPGGYQQQGYSQPGQPGGYQQQSYNVPPYTNANTFNNPNNPNTALNMPQNTAAGLSYILFAGLIVFLVEKQNRFVRFHAMQGFILFLIGTVLSIIDQTISNALYGTGMGLMVGCVFGLISVALFIVWLIGLINAFQGKYYKLPFIGDYAEKFANPSTPSL